MKKFRKPVKVGNFWSNNYIEWESNGDRNKTLSIEEYLKKISPYLSDITKSLENALRNYSRQGLQKNFEFHGLWFWRIRVEFMFFR